MKKKELIYQGAFIYIIWLNDFSLGVNGNKDFPSNA
jgi:hypothetical protein